MKRIVRTKLNELNQLEYTEMYLGKDDEIKRKKYTEIFETSRSEDYNFRLGFALIAKKGKSAFQWRVKSIGGMAVNFSKRVLRCSLGKCIVEISVLVRERAITRLRAVITLGYDGFARPFANDCRPVNAKPKMAQRAIVSFPIYIAKAFLSRCHLCLTISRRDTRHRIAPSYRLSSRR